MLAKIERIESIIGSQDNKIVALDAIVVGLPTTFISTKQVEAIFDRAIGPLLEALDNTRSETITPANFTQALTSESEGRNVEEVDGSIVEPEPQPIIEAISNIAAPVIQTPLPDATLPDAIAATVNPILSRPDALAIAKNFGFLGTGQNLYDWAKAALTSKSEESKLAICGWMDRAIFAVFCIQLHTVFKRSNFCCDRSDMIYPRRFQLFIVSGVCNK